VLTEVGPVEIDVPRDRDGSFEPKIVAKRQRRLSGVDELVLSLSAKGLTTGEVQAHLAEVYGAQVSRQTISTITDKVVEAGVIKQAELEAIDKDALKLIEDAVVTAKAAPMPAAGELLTDVYVAY